MTPRPEPLTREQRATMREAAADLLRSVRPHDLKRAEEKFLTVWRVTRCLDLLDDSDADKARIVELEEALRLLADFAPNLDRLWEWIREPDWEEQFSDAEVAHWLNERPCEIVPKLQHFADHAAAVLARTTRDPDARDQGGRSDQFEGKAK